jgi:polyphosphate glucokinase
MASGVKEIAGAWTYNAVSIGYPGPVLGNKPISEPHNLGRGWKGFDFEAAFGRPVKLINDAAMQALESCEGGKMLFLGLGTGLGSAMIADGVVEPMELGHLLRKRYTCEHYVEERGLERFGVHKWQRYVAEAVAQLIAALEPEEAVLGGGDVKQLTTLPPNCRAGDNANAFLGGFGLWDKEQSEAELKRGNNSRTKHETTADRAARVEGARRSSPKGVSGASARSVRGSRRALVSIFSIERKSLYADRNGWSWKNGRQHGAETIARRPRLRGFRYVGEGGGGTGSREGRRGSEPGGSRERTPQAASGMADGSCGRCRSIDRESGVIVGNR